MTDSLFSVASAYRATVRIAVAIARKFGGKPKKANPYTNEFRFRRITNGLSRSPCKCCPMAAEFLAGYAALRMEPFCATCIAPFVLQTLKCEGVNLRSIEAGFLKLSELIDAPPISGLVM